MKKKVLVTGKNGGLSQAIAQRFSRQDSCQTELLGLRGDSWKSYDFSSVHTLVHVAGMTPDKAKTPEDYYQINTELTRELAKKAKAAGVRHFIYLSSMAVYGVCQSINATAGMVTAQTPCKPDSDYGKSKLQAEQALFVLEKEDFRVTAVRVPSIYGVGKTDYMDQYLYLAQKLPVIPAAFSERYKSAISVTNLCEVIYQIAQREHTGIVCPDDGQYATVDFCCAIQPAKKKSRLLGKLIECLLKNNGRILDYYGAVYYAPELSNIFDGQYRIAQMKDEVGRIYGK